MLANLSGVGLTLFEPDSALYATVARTMAETGDFTHLIARGTDWLDKPHFPFWITALSFSVFGINTVAYKVPALAFWALGLVYTYRYALHLYSRPVARLSVLLLLTAQHLVLSNTDVRAEPYLVGLVIAALYHLVRAAEAPALTVHLVWSALFAACAVMTKGLFVLILFAGALLAEGVRRKRPFLFLDGRWWLSLGLLLLFISPELVALYRQFDLHPEKVVFGRQGVSGLRFFFWDSQFGRFLNTGPIRGKGDPFFFTHTLLWAFLPWSLLLIAAIGSRVRLWWQARRAGAPSPSSEAFSLGSAGLMFLVFSLSRFQLPHYLNVLFPMLAVVTAAFLCGLSERGTRYAAGAQAGVGVLLLLAGSGLLMFFRPERVLIGAGLLSAAALGAGWLYREARFRDAVGPSFCAAVAFNLVLTVAIYPDLIRYQAGSEAARFVNALPQRPAATFMVTSYAFQFYSRAPAVWSDITTLQRRAEQVGPLYVYAPQSELRSLDEAGFEVSVLARFDDYPITRITPRFLRPATRTETLREMVVVELDVASDGT